MDEYRMTIFCTNYPITSLFLLYKSGTYTCLSSQMSTRQPPPSSPFPPGWSCLYFPGGRLCPCFRL